MRIVHSISLTSQSEPTALQYNVKAYNDQDVVADTAVCFVCRRPTQGDMLFRLDIRALECIEALKAKSAQGASFPPVYSPYTYTRTKPLHVYFSNDAWSLDDSIIVRTLFGESLVPAHRTCLYSYVCHYMAFLKNHDNIAKYDNIFCYDTISILTKYYTVPYIRALRRLLSKAHRPICTWKDHWNTTNSTHIQPLAEYLSKETRIANHPLSPSQEVTLWMRNAIGLCTSGVDTSKTFPFVHLFDEVTFMLFPPCKIYDARSNYFLPASKIAQGLQKICFPDVRIFDTSGISVYL